MLIEKHFRNIQIYDILLLLRYNILITIRYSKTSDYFLDFLYFNCVNVCNQLMINICLVFYYKVYKINLY